MDSSEEVDDVVEVMQNWVLDSDDDFDSLAMLEINRSIQESFERALRTGNFDSESESDLKEEEDEDKEEDCSDSDSDEEDNEDQSTDNSEEDEDSD